MMKHPVAQRTWTVLTWTWLIFIVAVAAVIAIDEGDHIETLLATLAGVAFASQVPRAISYILTGQFKYFPDYSDQV